MFIEGVTRAIASTAEMRTQVVVGRMYGKRTLTPTPKELRSILPQTAFLQLLDELLEAQLDRFYAVFFHEESRIHICVSHGTQVMDIVHSLSLVLEKSGDRRSRGAVAFFDVATYFDRAPALLCARRLERAGASPALTGAVVRQQLGAQVALRIRGEGSVEVPRRSSGTLPGLPRRWPPRSLACGRSHALVFARHAHPGVGDARRPAVVVRLLHRLVRRPSGSDWRPIGASESSRVLKRYSSAAGPQRYATSPPSRIPRATIGSSRAGSATHRWMCSGTYWPRMALPLHACDA